MNDDDINDYLPSILNPRGVKKEQSLSLTQKSSISKCSLSLKRNGGLKSKPVHKVPTNDIENSLNVCNIIKTFNNSKHCDKCDDIAETNSIGFSAIEDLINNNEGSLNFDDFDQIEQHFEDKPAQELYTTCTDLGKKDESIVKDKKPLISISFGVNECNDVEVTSKYSAIKKFLVSHKNNSTNIDCDILEDSDMSDISLQEDNEVKNNTSLSSPRKRSSVAVNLEIKKQRMSKDVTTENSKVLILNTNAIEKISHVIIQPPNYKFVKRNNLQRNKSKTNSSQVNNNGNGSVNGVKLKQISIDSFFRKSDVSVGLEANIGCVNNDGVDEMSKNSGVIDAVKYDRVGRNVRGIVKDNGSPKSAKVSKREISSPKRQDVKTCNSDAPSPRGKNESSCSHSVRKTLDTLQFNLPNKKQIKNPVSPKSIPHHKIVAGNLHCTVFLAHFNKKKVLFNLDNDASFIEIGSVVTEIRNFYRTHFAVDAFSYGEIPNVKHYFLTHFHSDHYSGLKKNFNKILFCSKITADLCISRLGVNPKYIHVINVDEMVKVDGVEVTAVDANHCPGALMLVFTLPNGKTLLHTGDFRACPAMESYPVFWNKDIHTIYLDTTYCNPRYDFPTQDQSLDMAMHILRQKKMSLEKAGKRFSSVLIVCGTYSIGKEKFFLGMARRVGCGVWACAEKERVVAALEGRALARDPPHHCQLHVVPMRDLTTETLRSYLDSLQGAFNEVVAFKPSGWENGKNSVVEKDNVTIYGIPYSEHSSFSELVRFVKFLKPKQVIPTVDISGGVKAVQKYFPCPLVYKDEVHCQGKLTDYFSIQNRQQLAAVT